MSDLLAGLTAERLAQIAAGERNVAGQLEAQADAEFPSWPDLAAALREDATHHRQLAAICEALAKAERHIRAEAVGGHDLCIGGVGDRGVCTYWLSDEGDARTEWSQHETLSAALGSVGQQEKQT